MSTSSGQRKTAKGAARFVAMEANNTKRVIASGTNPEVVVRKAKQSGKPFGVAWVPAKGRKYVY